MVMRSRVLGCGIFLPSNVVTNQDLEQRVDTSDEWIVQRTGIKSRHIAAEGEKTSDLAIAAATRALEHAGVPAGSIDCIILATTTPDNTFPATATRVQAALGTTGFAMDIQAVCAGFVYAMSVADNFLRNGQARRALVIGAETFSRLLDWNDRTTCVLFGDGAGAIVLEAYEAKGDSNDRGVLSTHLHSDGTQYDLLYVDGGASSTGTIGHVRMHGQEIFRHAVSKLSAVVEEALAANGLESTDIDWMVPHQANRRIIDGLARKMKLSPEKVVLTVDRHGNTSAASIPLALGEAVADGRIKRGDLILMEAIGGGLTWGSALIRW
ncbi:MULTISPECIES: beta-ketoacyl-ACP synthase III [Azospirillum]|uniref:Beta-ketoacyl-[acyl-carrier-protein] synthase III n=1 Tax=Azospirillum lipoferum TaxID=193 RepID=A0A5A9GUE9_AZOLI|nr:MULTISPECIES: beta-ketoacyl-ACP synthase III [Azospirillum]KAA0597204.1 ketoacyl-ACP synthase III [Azospirillum lipoferum]MDW5535971.1 beta-ketoacyl-ACP synthase III [Azospirillum sp. NL1]